MKVKRIELEKTGKFASILTNYINKDSSLEAFYGHYPSIENFKGQIELKDFPESSRKTLVDSLKSQYEGFEIDEKVELNIESLLDDKTFTITTGHQLSIFTGPLFFHYKIISVINLCRDLTEKYPEYNFVPVFWMATEDHDFEEISSVNIGGHTIKWNSKQSGPVGRFNPGEMKSLFENVPANTELFEKSYLEQPTLAASVRHYVNALYGADGLVIIDGDDKNLKNTIANLIEEDCCHNHVNNLSEQASRELEKLGYSQQVFPREINFFHLGENSRDRIVKENNRYKVLNTNLSWSEEEFRKAIQTDPWNFSPNVLLRPMYQELILPNLAYIGGPAEIAYWLQLKTSFDHYEIPFPMLIPRNFSLLIKQEVGRKINKIGLEYEDLFSNKDDYIRSFVKKNSKNNLSAELEKQQVKEVWNSIAARIGSLNPTLEKTSEGFKQKTLKLFDALEKKMIRAEKRNLSDATNQIDSVFDTLFPKGKLQERSENYLTFLPDMPTLLDDLKTHLKPLDFRFHILIQE